MSVHQAFYGVFQYRLRLLRWSIGMLVALELAVCPAGCGELHRRTLDINPVRRHMVSTHSDISLRPFPPGSYGQRARSRTRDLHARDGPNRSIGAKREKASDVEPPLTQRIRRFVKERFPRDTVQFRQRGTEFVFATVAPLHGVVTGNNAVNEQLEILVLAFVDDERLKLFAFVDGRYQGGWGKPKEWVDMESGYYPELTRFADKFLEDLRECLVTFLGSEQPTESVGSPGG